MADPIRLCCNPRMPDPSLDALRRYAVARTLFKPTTLLRAIQRLGFLQADPIRAPARAQDLTLRHRVKDYRAGDLERRYPRLALEEDCLVNYGFLPREHLALMHPREPRRPFTPEEARRAADVLAFVQAHGPSHPRDVQAAFDHGRSRNAWGGESNAVTMLLERMHYRGWLRVVRREAGVRVYEAVARVADPRPPDERAQALLGLVVAKYAPLPSASLGLVARMLGAGAPQLAGALRQALAGARHALPSAVVDGERWFWPDGERPQSARHRVDDALRLLAPFDPIVWDRPRFERLWGWAYRFEAYTPAARRRFGHYALPLLWHDRVIGWANVAVQAGEPVASLGHAGLPPRGPAFTAALDDELARLRRFLTASD